MVKNVVTQEADIAKLLNEIEKELKNVFAIKLKKIILYGSYATNRNVEGSDLDIMVLVSKRSGIPRGIPVL